MIHGSWKTALIDIDVDADLTAEVDLGRPYDTAVIVCPALAVSATVSLMVAEKTGGTFQDLHITDPADGGNNQAISGAYTTVVFTWVVPIGGFQFVKIKLSAEQTGSDKTFRIMGVRS
jgi:hypothetical protein